MRNSNLDKIFEMEAERLKDNHGIHDRSLDDPITQRLIEALTKDLDEDLGRGTDDE